METNNSGPKNKIGPMVAIKRFFEQDSDREVSMDELKSLSSEERLELGRACAAALGVELVSSAS